MIIIKTKKPTPDAVERFCYYLHLTADPLDAAKRAGIDEQTALRLAFSRRVERKLSRLDKVGTSDLFRARAGLERLAFGRTNDAAELVLCSDEDGFSGCAKADLYNVSELKRVKGGGVEVKFFDRSKAIEQLIALDELLERKQNSSKFLSAFGAALSDGGEDDA